LDSLFWLRTLLRLQNLLECLLKHFAALIRAGLFSGFDEAGGLIVAYGIFLFTATNLRN